MTIYDLIFFSPFAVLVYGIWQHNNISIFAIRAASQYCKKVGVQLLDQNVILTRITIGRSSRSLFALRREYTFEFSSVGDFRYRGKIVLLGKREENIELAPFKSHIES